MNPPTERIVVEFGPGERASFSLPQVEDFLREGKVGSATRDEKDFLYGAVPLLRDVTLVSSGLAGDDIELALGDSLLQEFRPTVGSDVGADILVRNKQKDKKPYDPPFLKRGHNSRPKFRFPFLRPGGRILSAGGWTPHRDRYMPWLKQRVRRLVGEADRQRVKNIYLLLGINSVRGGLRGSPDPDAREEEPATLQAAHSVLGIARDLLGEFPRSRVFFLGAGDLSPTPKLDENPDTLVLAKHQVKEVFPKLVRRGLFEPSPQVPLTREEQGRIRVGLSYALGERSWPAGHFAPRDKYGHWSEAGCADFQEHLSVLLRGDLRY